MKLLKKYYLVILLILCLSSGIIYGSYALYTTGADFENVIEVGTDITYKFDINNTESIGVSNNSNFRFKGSLTNTIGSTMNYKFYYKVEGASSGVTVKEVTDGTMISSGSIANEETKTPEFYITNKSGGNVTVTVGVNFAYSGNPVTLDSGTNAITETIASSEAKTGNCTTNGIDIGDCTEECWTEYDTTNANWKEVCNCTYSYTYTDTYTKRILSSGTFKEIAEQLKITAKSGTPDFSSVAETDEGIYKSQDDYGTSYYFRGAVENNYVKFAGYYFRIIRINGDGTIRMIYDGTSAHANGESSEDRQISKSAFNSSKDDNAYVGFMYGSIGSSSYSSTHANRNSSTIKVALDNWYKVLSDTNKGYIADRVFCGDRSLIGGTGTGTATTNYGARNRLVTNKSPQLICPDKNDKYTVSDTSIGNGALDNPVGLITADEVAMAGGKFDAGNTSYYLCTGQLYWTISPIEGDSSGASVFNVNSSGTLDYYSGYYTVDSLWGVRPVVSLKSDAPITGGNGTQGSPWIVGTGN